jgi:phage FluMu protein Com
MVAFFIKFQTDFLTEEGGERLMAFFNVILIALKSEYRFPKKLSTLKVHAKVDKFFLKDVEEFAVCEQCDQHFLWKKQDEVVASVPTKCPTCKTISLFKNETKTITVKSFYYKSIIGSLRDFFYRPGFDAVLKKLWKRKTLPGYIGDACDGSNWDTKKVNGVVFTKESHRNLMLQLNVDWMQPWDGTVHSTGCMYMTILNLPREIRNKRNNCLLVGMTAGPKEPGVDVMYKYMQRLTDDLKVMMGGVEMEVSGKGMQTVKAIIGSIASDIPAQRKICGFASHSASMLSSCYYVH